jgi:hypothetical protein
MLQVRDLEYLGAAEDCCHGAHMLDVPSSWDSSETPYRVHQTFERPQAWLQAPTSLDMFNMFDMPQLQDTPRISKPLEVFYKKANQSNGNGFIRSLFGI